MKRFRILSTLVLALSFLSSNDVEAQPAACQTGTPYQQWESAYYTAANQTVGLLSTSTFFPPATLCGTSSPGYLDYRALATSAFIMRGMAAIEMCYTNMGGQNCGSFFDPQIWSFLFDTSGGLTPPPIFTDQYGIPDTAAAEAKLNLQVSALMLAPVGPPCISKLLPWMVL